MKHFTYLKYVLHHKWFVLLAGLKIGCPIWRLITHDMSKFRPSEWFSFADYFYGKSVFPPEDIKAASDVAWLHHQNRNPHHWQYWMLVCDSGETKFIDIPKQYILEMVADWAGAGRVITGKWEVRSWYEMNRMNILLSPATRKLVEYELKKFRE